MTAPIQPVEQGTVSPLRTRGAAYPAPGSDPRIVADYVKRLYRDGEPESQERYKRATYNLLFADGRQWTDWQRSRREWTDIPNPTGRVRAVVNLILPVLRARLQRLASGELSWSARPKTNALADRDRAMVAQNILPAHWELSDMDAKLRLSLFLAFTTGVVFWKQFWNPTFGAAQQAKVVLPHPSTGEPFEYLVTQDGQPLADEEGMPLDRPDMAFTYRPGEVDTAVRSVFNLRLNPDATGWTQAEGFRWLIDTEVVPLHVVKERYGEKADAVQATQDETTTRTYERVIRSLTTRMGWKGALTGPTTGTASDETLDRKMVVIHEYWEDRSAALPNGRLIVTAGDTVLYDDELPYGFVPYIALYDERRPLDPYGRPVITDLIPPQKVLNQQWSLIIEEMSRTGVGQWAAFDIPGVPDQITDEHGAVIKVPMRAALQSRRVSDVISRMPAPQPPRDRWELINSARTAIFDIGAYHEISRGQVPPGVDSGVAVQLLQEAEVAQLQDAVRSLKHALIQWAKQRLAIAKWGYGEDEERWIPVSRPDLGFMLESIRGADLPTEDSIDIDLKGFQPQSQAAFRAEIKELMQQQLLDPRQGLQLMDLGRGIDGAFASQTRHYARARRENADIENGQAVPTPQGVVHTDGRPFLLAEHDDHAIHLEILDEIVLDETLPWTTRQVAMLHAAEHRMVLQAQAAAMMAAQAQQSPEGQPAKEPPPA